MTNQEQQKIILSICIPTLNRADFIGETLDSITSQLQDGVEIVIVDGGSTDNTEAIIKLYQARFNSIIYHKKTVSNNTPSNEGFDRDCSLSVELASGEYCWLMTDDDIIEPDAIQLVLQWIKKQYDLIVINTSICNKDFSKVLIPRRPNIVESITFKPTADDWDTFSATTCSHLTFVGAVIIKTKIWLEREKAQYFGTGFIHVGVIFQKPFNGNILVTSQPLLSIRYGNAQWSNRAFKIWMFDWPNLIWSLPIAHHAKNSITPKEPWRKIAVLIRERALGNYSISEFNLYIKPIRLGSLHKFTLKTIALFPRKPLNFIAVIYALLKMRNYKFNIFTLSESWNR